MTRTRHWIPNYCICQGCDRQTKRCTIVRRMFKRAKLEICGNEHLTSTPGTQVMRENWIAGA